MDFHRRMRLLPLCLLAGEVTGGLVHLVWDEVRRAGLLRSLWAVVKTPWPDASRPWTQTDEPARTRQSRPERKRR